MSIYEISFDEKEYINIDNNPFITYVKKKKKILFNIEKYIRMSFEGERDYIHLSKDKQLVLLDDYCDVVDNIFVLDINTKKNINALYKILKSLYYEKLKENISGLKQDISKIVSEISLDFDLELYVSNEIKEEDLFKIMDLQFKEIDSDYKNRLIKYMEVINELRNIKVFFFFHLHDYFEKEELETIIKEIKYRNISVINIESHNLFTKNDNERIIIYDNDLCYIS